jgi:hypothetical protein
MAPKTRKKKSLKNSVEPPFFFFFSLSNDSVGLHFPPKNSTTDQAPCPPALLKQKIKPVEKFKENDKKTTTTPIKHTYTRQHAAKASRLPIASETSETFLFLFFQVQQQQDSVRPSGRPAPLCKCFQSTLSNTFLKSNQQLFKLKAKRLIGKNLPIAGKKKIQGTHPNTRTEPITSTFNR